MAGLAVMVERNSERASEQEFGRFAQRVAAAKGLVQPASVLAGWGCLASKFDIPQSLHRGATLDAETGSWLIAAGTVVDTDHPDPRGDLSALLKDYIAHGPVILKRLDGVFALAIFNGRARNLAVITDPFGFFSVFCGERGDCMFVGTSALAVAQQVGAAPNELGVQCFLRTGKVFGEMTLWQGVKRLRPSTVLELSVQGTKESSYWMPSADRDWGKLSLADAVDAAAQVLPRLLKRNLAREGKLWSDLTGGFDTRFMDVLLERAGIPFRANFVGPDDHPDVRIAQAIVERTGWEHEHFELPSTWIQDSPNCLQEALYRGDGHLNVLLLLRPLWVHHREREQFSTLLNGLGGEMARGPIWWPERAAIGRSTNVHYERQLWSLMHPIPEGVMASDSKPLVQDELTRQFRAIGERCPDASNAWKLDSVWLYRETSHAGAWTSAAGGLLRVIPAMFSKDIIEFVISLDYRWRVRNSLVKHLIFQYRPELSDIEVEGRGPAAPLRFDNWYRFVPSRFAWSRKALDKFSQVAFRRSLWRRTRPEGYSRLEWRRAILGYASAQSMLDPTRMRSGVLYRPEQLAIFCQQAHTDSFKHEELLGRIITVEMALRETRTAIQPI